MKKRPWHNIDIKDEAVEEVTIPNNKDGENKWKSCGAKTRKGTPCKNTRLFPNGRCKNHGGLSTGPKTEAGKAKAMQNLLSWKGND